MLVDASTFRFHESIFFKSLIQSTHLLVLDVGNAAFFESGELIIHNLLVALY